MKVDIRNSGMKRCGIAMGLLGLFMFYYSNVSFFTHTHIVNGVTIVHSHAHGESHSSSDNGHHSSSELTLMVHLSHFEASAAVPYFFDSCLYAMEFPSYSADSAPGLLWGYSGYRSCRAPPCCFSFLGLSA